MWTNSEKFLESPDHHRIHFEQWLHPKARSGILIVHGQGEHSGSYERFIQHLQKNLNLPLHIFTFDFRGHGRSDGIRGFANHPIEYVEDLETALADIQKNHSQIPLYILAHSMGGLVWTISQGQKRYRESFKGMIRAQILSSPFFGMSLEVPQWKTKSARFVKTFLPRVTLSNEIQDHMLTEDQEIHTEFRRDPLRHQKISAGVFLGFFDFFAEAMNLAPKITLPSFMFISQTDPVVSFEAAKNFHEALASEEKKLLGLSSGKHELLNDISREHIYKSIYDQIRQWENTTEN